MTIQLIGWALVHSLWQGGAIAVGAALVLWLARRTAPSIRYGVSLLALVMMVVLPLATVWRARSAAPSTDRLLQSVPPVRPAILPSIASPRSQLAGANRNATSPSAAHPTDAARPLPPASRPAVTAETTPAIDAALSVPTTLRTAWLTDLRRTAARWIDRALPWLVAGWLLGLVLLCTRLGGGLAKANRLARLDTRPAAEFVRATVRRLSDHLGVRSMVRVLETSRTRVPLVVGWIRPVILLPASVVTSLPPRQLEMLLAHELAHIRRHDFAINVLQTVVETLLFHHPAAWWLADRVREERENCCDDIAIAACGDDRATYGTALVALEEWRGDATGLAAAATGGPLFRRVMRLLRSEPAHVDLGPRWLAGVLTVLAVMLTAGRSVVLEAAPALAGDGLVPQSVPPRASREPNSRMQWSDTARARPDTVVRVQLAGTLPERWRAAEERARAAGRRTYWIGYVVKGGAGAPWYYIDHDVPVRAGTSIMTGRLRLDGSNSTGGLIFAGAPLAPLVGAHPPEDRALFFRVATEGRSTQLAGVHLGSFALPVYFDRLPLFWLDEATDAESLAQLQRLFARSRDRQLRGDLLSMIGAHGDSRLVVPMLASVLRDRGESADVRGDAAGWLGYHATPQSLAALSAVARREPDERVRDEAVEAFARMPLEAAADTLMLYARTLESRAARAEAIEALGERPEPRVVSFLERFVSGTDDESLRVEALEALAEVPGGAGFDAIVAQARGNRDVAIRRAATEQLPNLEPTDRALEALLDIVRRDPDLSVRTEAVESIADVPDARALAVLKDLIDSDIDEELQMEAVESMTGMESDEDAIAELARLARVHPRSQVRHKAVESLGDFESDAAVARLLEIAESHPEEPMQAKAAEALGSAGSHERAVEALRRIALGHPRLSVRKHAVESLGDVEGIPDAQKTLIEIATRGADSELQRAAIETLAGSSGAARDALASIARGNASEDVRMAAIEAFASDGDTNQIVSFLQRVVADDSSERVRRMALETLSDLDDDAGLPAVRQIARSSADPRMRQLATDLLTDR